MNKAMDNNFLTPLNSSRKNNNSSLLKTVKEIVTPRKPKLKLNPNIFDEFKTYMNIKIKNKNSNSPKKEEDQSDMAAVANTHVEKILHNKYKIKGHNNFKRFEDKMKVFKILDTYVDVKDYLKKMNLLYNPQMKEILEEKKKTTLRKEFQHFFGVNINELESPNKGSEFNFEEDLINIERNALISKARNTVDTHRKLKYKEEDDIFEQKKSESCSEINGELKNYLMSTFHDSNRISYECENDSRSQIFDKIDEYYKDQKQENFVKMRSKMKILQEASPDPAKLTHYAKEMEKFQNLIENSIDFNLIKKVKDDEEDVPSNFYYTAYKRHAEKVQTILKKTCQKLYNKKLDHISMNKSKLSNRIKEEAEKLQTIINFKLVNKPLEKMQRGHLKPRNSTIPSMTDDYYTKSFSQKSQIHDPRIVTSLAKIEDFQDAPHRKTQINIKKNVVLPIENSNSNIKSKFSNLIKKINISQIENADKKMMIEKEISDIENVFEKELEQIKLKQFQRVEAIRDFKIEEKVETKVKMIRSYFSNKKKGKYIIKL